MGRHFEAMPRDGLGVVLPSVLPSPLGVRGGLGPELVNQYDFNAVGSWELQSALTIPGDGYLHYDLSGNHYARQDFAAVNSLVELKLMVSSGNLRISIRSYDNSVYFWGDAGTVVSPGLLTARFVHSASGIRLLCLIIGGSVATFDYLSLRQIL